MMRGRTPLAAATLGLTLWAGQAGAAAAPPSYSAAQLYNLANSYARAGQPGMAVLNYERARLLTPSDPDIQANLRRVRDSSHLPSDSPNGFELAVTWGSPTALAWIGVLGLLLAGIALIAGRMSGRRPWLRRAALVAGFAAAGLTVCNAAILWPTLHAAVVITNATPVRVSPVPMGDPAFVLPEAETVRVTAEHEDFLLIQTRTGRTGWVSRANLVPVVPAP
jgi:hypothetical protein